MHKGSGMIDPIRDHWLIALAVMVVSALGVWLVATRRRS
jgi:cytochrome b561